MKISYRHNVMSVNSIDTFLNVKGGYNNDLRDVYFVRGIGEPADIENMMLNIDKKMDDVSRSGKLSYFRVSNLPALSGTEDVDYYSRIYESWKQGNRLELKCCKTNELLADVVSDATKAVVDLYKEIKPSCSETMEKNFVVKLWFWLDSLMNEVLSSWNERSCMKVLADNVVKEQEYLFYYMVTLLGCDVFLIENKKDIQVAEKIAKLSATITLGEYGTTTIPQYVKNREPLPKESAKECKTQSTENNTHIVPSSGKVKISIPEHAGRKKTPQSVSRPSMEHRTEISSSYGNAKAGGSEKSFEELARLASSIVMICVHDSTGEPIAGGSGIMIGRDGYILTNNHVLSKGRFFSVRIEDDEEMYTTDEVIKYNNVLDLAVIRIHRTLNPIPIYNGSEKLVRGQKVVAIGSPLGLFNSVSDGIISGFRNIHDVDMIQFTAPISHGSSGGAVLNMQGEVIGISTAGFDDGQNINLAVGYESIKMFARGFF